MDINKSVRSSELAQPVRAGTSIVIVGSTASALGLNAVGTLPTAHGAVYLTEFANPPVITDKLLGSLAGSDIAVLARDRDSFTSAERQICLLAWHLHGELPIIVSSSKPGDPRGLVAAHRAVESFARALGATQPPVMIGAQSLPDAIDLAIRRIGQRNAAAPLRMSIGSCEAESISGSIVAGVAKPGLEVVILPHAAPAVVTRVAAAPDGSADHVIGLDRPIAAETGQMVAAAHARPELADQVAAHIIWLADTPLLPGRPYGLRLASQSVTAQISALKHKINPANLDPIAARRLELGDIGLCNVSFASPLIFDQVSSGGQAGGGLSRFTIEDPGTGDVLGVGQILFTLRRAANIHWQALAIDKAARAALKEQRPCCLWFTGLSGSGKSTVASLLEKRLNAMSRHTYTLDGDNVRHGLNRDLGFTDADRVENIRRIAEVSKLFVDSGLIVMVSFISPFRAERDMARSLFPPGEFLEIHVDTPIDICEQRDPKGLYRKARAGQLKNFTGIDSPYEPPERAELSLDSGRLTPETLVDQILRELARRGMVDLAP